MRVALVNDTFLKGRGADTVVYELAKRLGKEHEVYVLTGETNIKEENFKILKIKLPKLFTGSLKDFNYPYKMYDLRKEIKRIQKNYRFNIFFVFHSNLNPAFLGLPTIVTWLGSPRTKNIFRRTLNNFLLKTLKENKKTIVISKYLRKKINFLKDVSVIYCGISKEFKPLKKEQDRKYMLYVGRLEKHKKIQEIIELSRELNFPLKIVGYGPEERSLKKIKDKLNAPVDFLGRVSKKELIKLYQECSFFVSSSEWEGFGLIFLEAAACSKPSVAYRIGSIPEVIIDEKTGLLANNYLELKQMANFLITNPKIRREMGKKALDFSKNFDWDRSAREYIEMSEGVKGLTRIDYSGKKVLVNGVSGFIGSNLAKELLKRGAEVYSIDNFSYINEKMMKERFLELKKIKIIKGDVSKPEAWKKIPKGIDYIFHFSAPSSIVLFKKYPEKCYNETVLGLYRALEFAKQNKVKKVIYPSSGAIYSGNKMPHTETVYPKPRNLYGTAKIACEALANSYCDFVPSIGLRIFVGYGPGEEWKEEFGSAPFLFIRDLMNGKSPEIWGDGGQTRDLIYIDDLVAMTLRAAEVEYAGIVNVGTGQSLSFKDVVKKAKDILKTDVEPEFVHKKDANYLEHIKADVNLNKRLLGIKPMNPDEGLKRFIDYLKASS
jgi:UDP-glucose 4-epimerase